ncbi:hypothetical protein PVAP13_7KG173965 [Panicum virgatum]|uniref:TF-B3 domain-containing protein n=1 Tax=Panicum virgatum TaxID=38727 RepID=A0A8T0Q8W6_PANVG|nr:hypothetical protein PVAP13_7KG173965 [Panicum virgatum]
MASFGGRGGGARKNLRVLLPFTCDSLRIADELAEEIGAGEAHVVGPPGTGREVWPVEVGWDGDGAFLGRRWPEFAGACGVEGGWLLVVRHHGRGLLTVKAFDRSCCLREIGAPPAVGATPSSKGSLHKPQFISVLQPESLEKMLIPAQIRQHCIPENLNSCMTIVLRPPGKIAQIELKMDDQSDLFLTGGWSQFLASHGITDANALLLKYEGNMVWTVKVFEHDGCQRGSRNKDIRMQQDMEEQPSSACTHRCCRDREKKPKGPMTRLNKATLLMKSVYEIGPPSWIKKQINANTLKELALATSFCDVIGLRKPCMITLKTSMISTESWQVCGLPRKNKSYMLRQGWTTFCKENNLMEGDICTFNIIETTSWHVIITWYKEEMINQLFCESVSASKRKSENDRSSSEEKMRLKCSMTSLNKASSKTSAFEMGPPAWIKGINGSSIQKQFRKSKSQRSSNKEQKRRKSYKTSLNKESTMTKCVFEIGPSAWIKKEMNDSTIERQFCLPLSCKVIGLRKPCMITLKTSPSSTSTSSWLVSLHPYQNCSQLIGSGWKTFCYENKIRVGDVCTFKIVETTQWDVIIECR